MHSYIRIILPAVLFVASFAEADPLPQERRTVSREPVPAGIATLTVGDLVESGADYDAYQRNRASLLATADTGDFAVWFGQLRRDERPPLMRRGQWHACVNDLFSHLTRHPMQELDLQGELISVIREAEDTVVRDYALQHIAILARAKPADSGAALSVLREAATWKNSPLSGTALLNLYHLDQGLDDGALAESALAVAGDPTAHEASRSTALQVGVLLNDKRFLAPAADIARRSPIVAHRASAARALAAFGGPEQRPLLLRLRRRGPEPITNIANEALAQFENDR